MTQHADTPFFAGKTVVVVGLARSGVAAVRLLRAYGCDVRATDARARSALGASADECDSTGATLALGGHPAEILDGADLVVVSPGVPLTIPFLAEAERRGLPITSEIELAAAICPAPIVAVTGTNGKTTTTELIGHLFRTAGRHTIVAGNVGRAFSGEVERARPDSIVVLEVSSFQLETSERFHPRVAVLLNLTPDHLDRHGSFEAYGHAKARIFARQTHADYAVLNAGDPAVVALASRVRAVTLAFSVREPDGDGAFVRGENIWYRFEGTECAITRLSELQIRGPHNVENALAAVASTLPFGVEREMLARGLASFRPLPHRLEPVGEIRGVQFVNDSKATNVDALEKALRSFDRPVVLIAGGRDKAGDFARLSPLASEKVGTVLLLGEAAPKIRTAWPEVPSIDVASLEEAVRTGFAMADAEQTILLAPGCASFDMFRDYEDRGDQFRAAVTRLAEEIASGRVTR
jgi:UDP-N-acetylmuramoylalanine--D-glutamate ligase